MIYRRKPKNFNPAFEVVSCYCEFNNQILLLKRLGKKSQGGKWGVPAGKVNRDEDKVAAMMREIKEETGVNILPADLKYFKSVYVHHTFDFVYHMFSCQFRQTPRVRISPREHEDFIWIPIDGAMKLPLVDDLDKCIEMFYTQN